MPTLPAAALQVHALPVLDRFVALLEQAGVGHLDALPRQVRSAADSQQLMRSLRRAIAGDPVAARRAMARLDEGAAGAAQASEERSPPCCGSTPEATRTT